MKIHIDDVLSSKKSIILDTGTNSVTISEVFLGLNLVSDDGERLSICMRDSGFEMTYSTPWSPDQNIRLVNGQINRTESI